MPMHNSPHPRGFITSVYFEPNGISGRELAAKLDVAASTLSRVPSFRRPRFDNPRLA